MLHYSQDQSFVTCWIFTGKSRAPTPLGLSIFMSILRFKQLKPARNRYGFVISSAQLLLYHVILLYRDFLCIPYFKIFKGKQNLHLLGIPTVGLPWIMHLALKSFKTFFVTKATYFLSHPVNTLQHRLHNYTYDIDLHFVWMFFVPYTVFVCVYIYIHVHSMIE